MVLFSVTHSSLIRFHYLYPHPTKVKPDIILRQLNLIWITSLLLCLLPNAQKGATYVIIIYPIQSPLKARWSPAKTIKYKFILRATNLRWRRNSLYWINVPKRHRILKIIDCQYNVSLRKLKSQEFIIAHAESYLNQA